LCDIDERVANYITICWQHVQFDGFRWINVGSRLQHDVNRMGTGMEVELGHGSDIASNKKADSSVRLGHQHYPYSSIIIRARLPRNVKVSTHADDALAARKGNGVLLVGESKVRHGSNSNQGDSVWLSLTELVQDLFVSNPL
jgi:hypothetical protein